MVNYKGLSFIRQIESSNIKCLRMVACQFNWVYEFSY